MSVGRCVGVANGTKVGDKASFGVGLGLEIDWEAASRGSAVTSGSRVVFEGVGDRIGAGKRVGVVSGWVVAVHPTVSVRPTSIARRQTLANITIMSPFGLLAP